MRPAFVRDMLCLVFVALAQMGGLWTLPLALMCAVAVTRWNASGMEAQTLHPKDSPMTKDNISQPPGNKEGNN